LVLSIIPLSGEEMLRLYKKAGWYVISQRGSHVKVGKDSLREIIPMHKELKEQALLKRLASQQGGPK
jgi:predicted RNA binding protein YcfA (HicA-like mRNA interferase family)